MADDNKKVDLFAQIAQSSFRGSSLVTPAPPEKPERVLPVSDSGSEGFVPVVEPRTQQFIESQVRELRAKYQPFCMLRERRDDESGQTSP